MLNLIGLVVFRPKELFADLAISQLDFWERRAIRQDGYWASSVIRQVGYWASSDNSTKIRQKEHST